MSSNSIINSSLINEWDYAKNTSLDPQVVTTGSNKKAWWKCLNGHEYEAQIYSRFKGGGCPYCKNKKINSENNFAIRFPELAKEWDYEKNVISANEIFPGSVKKYWWKCKSGHSYQSSPNKRTSSNRGCPYCSGRLVSAKNSFIELFPLLVKEFNIEKNHAIDINKLSFGSQLKVWWKCKKGHEWETTIANRTGGTNCPLCNSQVSRNELRIYSELKFFFGDIGLKRKINGFECDILLKDLNVAIEYDGVYWHKGKLSKDKLKNEGLLNAGIFLIRVRELGLKKISEVDIIYDHTKQPILFAIKKILEILIINKSLSEEIQTKVTSYLEDGIYKNELEYRELLDRLPSPIIEDSLDFKFPNLIPEWNTKKNMGLLPMDVSSKSSLKVWWQCKEGHEWESSVGNRTQGGNGCPYCNHQLVTYENSLAFIRPDLIDEWDVKKNDNILASEIFAYSSKKYWWRCKQGHEWIAMVSNRSGVEKKKNTKCPFCSNRRTNAQNNLAVTNPKLASEWNVEKNNLLTPEMVVKGSDKRVWWQCSKMHEWEASISSRNRGNGCPYCSNQKTSLESSLFSKRPDLVKEWNVEKNKGKTAKDFTDNSGKKVWWKCKEGHEWEATIGYRNKSNSRCPICSGQVASEINCLENSFPEVAKEWNYSKNGLLTPRNVTKKSARVVWWICENKHEWKAGISPRVSGRYKCPQCKIKNI